MELPADPKDFVRRAYDQISHLHRADNAAVGKYEPWLAGLRSRLPRGADVLDLGCGCGVPVSRELARAGHSVTGVDLSDVQVERARALVPDARFVRADAGTVEFAPASFDAVVCLYLLIHLPPDEQPRLLRRIAGWVRPGGWLVALTGYHAWTGYQPGWLGGEATMWWSNCGAGTYHRWIREAGFEIAGAEYVTEGRSGHAVFWACRPPSGHT
jgi:2-polyprenyl-3-methyl-5-hydroxy-6-metoxy-1,4-benzoquinol methylase